MNGPDNGLTRPLLIKTLAQEIAKMVQKLADPHLSVQVFEYLKQENGPAVRVNLAATIYNPRAKDKSVLVVLDFGVASRTNLCTRLLSEKRAKFIWPLAVKLHAKAMEKAKRILDDTEVMRDACWDFVEENEHLMSHFKES
jgi:mannose/fructose-specific phosphotransferase system component IIA